MKVSKAQNLNYIIEPGSHSSTRYRQSRRGKWKKSLFSWLPFKLIRGQFVKLQATILFQTDNWHPLPDSENKDWFDINKLIGINFGLSSPHKNSFRIGYIHDYQNPNEVKLYLYYYEDGVRYMPPIKEPIAIAQMGVPLELTIMKVGYENRFYVHIWQDKEEILSGDYKGIPVTGDLYEDDDILLYPGKYHWFSVLEPYHGGNLASPNKQSFHIDDLIITYQ